MKKLCLLLCFVTTNAFALNVQKFKPIVGQTDDGVGVYSARGIEKGQVELGFFLSYLNNALEFGNASGNPFLDEIAEHFLTGHFKLSWGISDRVTLRGSLPINFYSKVEPISTYLSTEDVSLGDFALDATISLKHRQLDAIRTWGIALVPFVTVPFQNEDDFFGDTNFTGGFHLAFDNQFHKRHYVALNVGSKFREEETILNLTVDHEFLYGASYVFHLSPKSKWDIIAEVIGSSRYQKFFAQEITSPYEGFLSIRKRSQDDRWTWTTGAGRAGNNGYGAPDFHVYTGLAYRCCTKKEEPKPVVINPGTFEFEVVDQHDNPLVLPLEIVDAGTTLSIYEVTSNRIYRDMEVGEYSVIARDGDQEYVVVFDIEPDELTKERLVIEKTEFVEYVDPIYFDVNKATIKPESYTVLDHVLELIAKYENIEIIAINAHTDSDGSIEYNLGLSRRRAQSVKDYLINKGIDPKMIRSAGFGESQPKVANTSKENKAKNRRVEFELTGKSLRVRIINR